MTEVVASSSMPLRSHLNFQQLGLAFGVRSGSDLNIQQLNNERRELTRSEARERARYSCCIQFSPLDFYWCNFYLGHERLSKGSSEIGVRNDY